MLSAKEESQLRMLTEKAKKLSTPLSDDELSKIDERVKSVFDRAPEIHAKSVDAWNIFVKELSVLAEDNKTLINEIKRLKSLSIKGDENVI